MMKFWFFSVSILLFACNSTPEITEDEMHGTDLDWKPFTKSIFEEAKSQDKLVLLNIGANWCHWCHVMDDSTYANSEVQSFLQQHFILSHEDQDSRSDLFSKYRNYGWPATIIFNSNGDELLKLKGYHEKSKFLSLLDDVVKNPTVMVDESTESVTETDSVSNSSIEKLITTFNSLIDHQKGSLKTPKKLLTKNTIDLALNFSSKNDSLKNWLTLSVKNSYLLLDPVWGGVYQYSTNSDWKHQHFEKILRIQAEYISMYCDYSFQFSDKVTIQNAEKIYNYCNRFLSDRSPLFDNSQDADYIKGVESSNYYSLPEEERLKLGTPAVNHQQFLKENAMMSIALVKLWANTSNANYLIRAKEMVDILALDFAQPNGLFSRSIEDNEIYSLEDNTAMLEALTMAYQISGKADYLEKAEELAEAILSNFSAENGSLFSSCGSLVVESTILPQSNYSAAFALLQIGNISKTERLTNSAESILHAIYRSEFDSSEYLIPSILFSKKHLDEEPLHAVWISDKFGTNRELKFVQTILLNSFNTIVIDRVDLKNLSPEQELRYGSTKPNTLFICTSVFCSSPITTIEQLNEFFKSRTQTD